MQFTERWLQLTREDGHESVYPALWLYNNRPEHRDQGTGQRLVDVAGLPPDPNIAEAEVRPGAVSIRWRGEDSPSLFPMEWLLAHCLCAEHTAAPPRNRTTWTAEETSGLCWMDHRAVIEDRALRRQWLRAIARNGIAFLRNVPVRDGAVLEVASILGYITETNYGRLFDVRAVNNPNNLAYTPDELGVHTDNPYRNPVPGFQLLHCLTPCADGGESIFVDGFRVAEELRPENPDAFGLLCNTSVRFAFRDADTELEAERPFVQLNFRREIDRVHYNSRALAPLRIPASVLPEFYDAYRTFARLIQDQRFALRLRLGSGDLVSFDNHRILHGRTAFRGERRLQGCYVNHDGLFSNLAVLERDVDCERHRPDH